MAFDRRALPADATLDHVVLRDGWRVRRYRQPARGAPRGSLLWLGGRGDIVEKYLEALDHWAGRGWHVTSWDWRGQGGSGRLAAEPLLGHVTDFAIWIDDLAELAGGWGADGPRVALGHSMGGHLLLRALAERRLTLDRAVLVAPMLGFETGRLPFGLARRVAGLLGTVLPRRQAWRSNERPAHPSESRQTFLTSDRERYADELWWKERHPGLALGPPSWGWLRAAYASVAGLRRPDAVEGVATPLLLLGTEGDALVSPAAIRAFAARLPNAQLEMYDRTVAHEILRERDDARNAALARIDAFLDAG